MKTRPALLAVLASLTLLTACGSSSTDPADVDPDTAGQPDDADVTDTDELVDAHAPPDAAASDAPMIADGVAGRVPPRLTEARLFTPGEGVGTVRVQPALAFLGGFSVLAAWTGDDGDGGLGIWTSRLEVFAGEPRVVRPAERLNTDTRGIQNEPRACAWNGARAVIVWSVDTQETGPDGENLEIRFRRVDSAGAPIDATDRRVLTDRPGNHWLASVACHSTEFAVAGVRPGEPGAGFEVFVQRYDGDGEPTGAVIVPRAGSYGQGFPALASGHGRLAIAFEDAPTAAADTAILAGLIWPTPGPLRVVATLPGQDAARATVALDPAGEIWLAGGTVGTTVQLTRFATPEAEPFGGFFVPEAAGAVVTNATVEPMGEGRFAVVYTRGTGSAVDLRVAFFSANGTVTDEVTVASGSFPLAYRPAITYRLGTLAVAWTESLGGGVFTTRGALFKEQP